MQAKQRRSTCGCLSALLCRRHCLLTVDAELFLCLHPCRFYQHLPNACEWAFGIVSRSCQGLPCRVPSSGSLALRPAGCSPSCSRCCPLHAPLLIKFDRAG